MLQARYLKHSLIFKRPSGTSRGVLKTKDSWFILLSDGEKTAIGECGLLRGLSVDPWKSYEETLGEICEGINKNQVLPEAASYKEYPSIRFGLEILKQDWETGSERLLFPSEFTRGNKGITINGLIWMGERSFMFEQIKAKIEQGFSCIKLKIGAINFEEELSLLRYIRSQFSAKDIELRVDANGAFSPEGALDKLKRLSELDLHSIEQPIKQKQFEEMARLCANTPLAIALDEELIGVVSKEDKQEVLDIIKPQYIILKPSLVGGFASSEEWMSLADERKIRYWGTSALESNIGLNALAQWTFKLGLTMPQGLGTGALYTNNIPTPLEVVGEELMFIPKKNWDYGFLQ